MTCKYCGGEVSAERDLRARQVTPIEGRKTYVVDTCSQICRTAWRKREGRRALNEALK
jgi:hypothetical protein